MKDIDFNELEINPSTNVNVVCKSVKKKKKSIQLLVEIDSVIDGMRLQAWDKQKNDKNLDISYSAMDNNSYTFSITPKDIVDLNNCMGRAMELYLEITVKDSVVLLPLTLTDVKEKDVKRFASNPVRLHADCYYSVYYSVEDDERIAKFEVRDLYPAEKISERVRMKVAQGIALVLSKFIKKPIWLIGENLGEMAQDNGFAFFEYCTHHRNKNEKVYYVTKKENKNYQNLVNYTEHLVTYDSFKHCILYHLSEYLIVSHGIRDVIPSVRHRSMAVNPKDIIYLQHGITAMKKLFFNSNSYNGKIRKFVVNSEFEKNIFINEMHFRPDQLMVTGFPRFDNLNNQSNTEEKKSILIIPTWREWLLNTEEEFIKSDFYQNYNSLLNNDKLLELVEQENMDINFYAHIEIQRKYLHLFKSNRRINIIDASKANIKELMEKASLMITDYSSVAFDFNYMRKPVIFYQFDLEEYLYHRGAYIDMEKDLCGDVIFREEDLLNCIKEFVKDNFQYKKEMIQKSQKYYLENNGMKNSERTYNEIKKLVHTK